MQNFIKIKKNEISEINNNHNLHVNFFRVPGA